MANDRRRGVSAVAGARLVGVALLAVVAASCASRSPAPRYGETVTVEPSAPPVASPLPALPPVSQLEESGASRRIQNLEVVDQELPVVLRGLAESYGLDYQIDPAVRGRVTTRLRDVTLEQALEALLAPHGYAFQLQERVLRVVPARLQTRIFSLEYISMTRVGVGTTVIQRRLGTAGAAGELGGLGAGTAGSLGGGLGGGFGGTGAADVIQSVTVANLWTQLRISLEGLLFDTELQQAAPEQPAAGGMAQGALVAQGAYSRVGEDGRRLVVNPISGTVLVSASPEKLAEVAMLLAAIEASVQRQVLIEAKIVEVSLDREFRFGIDWGLVQRVGNVDLRIGAGRGGAEFTLRTPDDEGRQVEVVLDALESQGEVSVLSNPRVSVMNNQRAVINVARDEVFFSVTRQPLLGPNGATIGFTTAIEPQQISVGITLDVLPQISPDNTISMNVRPVVTDLLRVDSLRLEDGTQASAPVIDRRETDTVVRVRGGETIIIGGLMQTRQVERRSGVPLLRDVPVLGHIFGGTSRIVEKRELVIFITPRIIAGQPPIGE